MQFTTTAILSLLAALGSAAPADLEARQGGSYYAVGEHYKGGGCTSGSLIFADPIYIENACTPLDRFGTEPDIVSYKLLSVSAGCHGKFNRQSSCGMNR
ncbi:hypothetical protein BCR34DRAFT_476501 [Clohesyomyces aquaticus]|uniref:Uncharacterized protein n=1 Tax=Clohesyomyces aquaticus TaxID=1231657 RepID=A0A1Y2A192_9PLEO|nr:hypothetical protein BCR34DRAFT_476501 [Clohesyomyces aquaticus]